MKRILAFGCLLAVVCAAPAFAQRAAMPKLGVFSGANRTPMPAGTPAASGEGMYWSGDDLKKAFPASKEVTMGNFAWTPIYRLSVVQRPAYADSAKAGSEMHEDKTQIYFILSGTGTQVLGGNPEKDNASADGQHTSEGPLAGGKSFKIKPGDMILIPPKTWHQTLPDAGQTVTYQMVHIETRTRLP